MTRVNNDLVSLQRDLAKRNAELTAITRQRNQLLATAAHDLRNPILVVQGYCDLLGIASSPEGSPQREFVAQVKQASELMLHVIEETLEFAQLEAGEVRPRRAPVDLSELVRRSAASYGPSAARKDIELVVTRTELVPLLWLDATNIERVIGNLLSNANQVFASGRPCRARAGLVWSQRRAHGKRRRTGHRREPRYRCCFGRSRPRARGQRRVSPAPGWVWPSCAIWSRQMVERSLCTRARIRSATFEVSLPTRAGGRCGRTQMGNELGREPAVLRAGAVASSTEGRRRTQNAAFEKRSGRADGGAGAGAGSARSSSGTVLRQRESPPSAHVSWRRSPATCAL